MSVSSIVPASFGFGFYQARIFVNTSSPNYVYFGDLITSPLLQDISNAAVDICSTRVSGSSLRDSQMDGNYDMMNFAWFRGAFGNVWISTTGNNLNFNSLSIHNLRPF